MDVGPLKNCPLYFLSELQKLINWENKENKKSKLDN